MRFKILLVEPPWYRLFGSGMCSYPRALCYIASFLEKHGFDAKVYNADFDKCVHLFESYLTRNHSKYLGNLRNLSIDIWREVRTRIEVEQPKIVGI